MIELNITDETSKLESVVLGTPDNFGDTPQINEAYDPKSKQHIINGTFPTQRDITLEMNQFCKVLKIHGVNVLRPIDIDGLNQIFCRDIGFVIENKFIIPQILEDRSTEIDGIQYILEKIPVKNRLAVSKNARIEGGDVMPWKGKLFVGYSKSEDFNKFTVARTNEAGVQFLRRNFPDWEVIPIELKKSDSDPKTNALHLDCCFQPIGNDKAILHKEGFKNQSDFEFLFNFFTDENCFLIDSQEMYEMNSNVFSISPEIIVSDSSFHRLNNWLTKKGFFVEGIDYREIAKMEGLLRCSTLPLKRLN